MIARPGNMEIQSVSQLRAFRRDNPNAVVQFLDTDHFATETHVEEIARAMRNSSRRSSLVLCGTGLFSC